jgi:hypothetical protein
VPNKRMLLLRVQLPDIARDAPRSILRRLTADVAATRVQARAAFGQALEGLVRLGQLKRYKDVSELSLYHDHVFSRRPAIVYPDEMRMVHLLREGTCYVGYVAFQVSVSHDAPVRVPKIARGARVQAHFVRVNEPWHLRLHSARVEHLKTIDKLQFRLFLYVRLPLVSPESLPAPPTCRHDFQILHLGNWEWRLLWTCRHCGMLCHCACFKRAILAEPCMDRYLGSGSPALRVRPDEPVFVDRACEVCRGAPSTNAFCSPMYARGLFEQRYGAYVRKRMIELELDGVRASDEEALEQLANNEIRARLGFPAIGQGQVSETELYRIVCHLFPQANILRHHRPSWLGGLELDIWLPEKRLALEYQGLQHFEPVSAWGGGSALRERKARDDRKRKLCQANDVTLVIFTCNDELSCGLVSDRLMVHRIQPA